ncbi:MAG TPA: hypothetical protein VNT75_05775 [Symbiobacteriaceae bacterium]|nr:hypothetical protein [Symbiobacteriaceae bacterium]
MTWREGFEENWTNAVHMTAARLERQLDAGAAPTRETVRKVLQSVSGHWQDANHFYGVWLRDFQTAHPKAGRQFQAILDEMAQNIDSGYRAPSPLAPVAGGLVVGAAAFGLLAMRDTAPALAVTAAVAAWAVVALVWWTVAQGSRRGVKELCIAQVSRELGRYGERLRRLVSEADGIDTAAGE